MFGKNKKPEISSETLYDWAYGADSSGPPQPAGMRGIAAGMQRSIALASGETEKSTFGKPIPDELMQQFDGHVAKLPESAELARRMGKQLKDNLNARASIEFDGEKYPADLFADSNHLALEISVAGDKARIRFTSTSPRDHLGEHVSLALQALLGKEGVSATHHHREYWDTIEDVNIPTGCAQSKALMHCDEYQFVLDTSRLAEKLGVSLDRDAIMRVPLVG